MQSNATNTMIGASLGGNVIAGNVSTGIEIGASSGTVVSFNLIGTDNTNAVPNGIGILVDGATNVTIGGDSEGEGNAISGSTQEAGVLVSQTQGIVISGNFIGTNLGGSSAIPNITGVLVGESSGVQIGGETPGQRNIISGNTQTGIALRAQSGAVIEGNYIGLDAAGVADLGNGDGVVMRPDSVGEGVNNNIIRGNVISGSGSAGIDMSPSNGAMTNGNEISDNIIGLNAAGTDGVSNGGDGIIINTEFGGMANGNLIFDSESGGNVISANQGNGIKLRGQNTSDTGIYHNLIGTNAAGTEARGNEEDGVRISLGADSNSLQFNTIAANVRGVLITDPGTDENEMLLNYIGTNSALASGLGNTSDGISVSTLGDTFVGGQVGPAAGPGAGGNVIMHNGGDGIDLPGALSTLILANSIDLNAGLGIDRDAGFPLAPPALTSAQNEGGGTHVTGSATGAPGTLLTIEFFVSPGCDPSGSGEGRDYLGTIDVTANGSGLATIDIFLNPGGVGGQVVTATSTEGATSEFSNCTTIVGPTPAPTPAPTPVPTDTPAPTPTGTPTGIFGDANCDGVVDLNDAIAVLEVIADVGDGDPCGGSGDVNCNEILDAEDALRILAFAAVVPLPQPALCPEIGSAVS